jgi:hypothetical protein
VTVSEPESETVYLRGGGVTTDARHALRLALAFSCAALAVLLVFLVVGAVREGNREDRLRDHGVAVSLTVTSCLGLASGTGATEYGWDCQGTFALNGRQFNELLHGSNTQLAVGTVVAAVADPGDPSNVSTAASAKARHARGSRWIPSGITLLLLVRLVGPLVRGRRQPAAL